MMFKILIIVTLAKVCMGNTLDYHEPHSSVKHAISSQSFVRHDVPISYKHSEVHIYTTEKPHNYGHQPIIPAYQLSKLKFLPQKIQYAPVVHDKKTELGYTITNVNREPAKKTNLEPNLHSHPAQLALIPGHNIETVNRYPGHNAVYRSYSNMKPDEQLLEEKHTLKPYFYERKPEITVTTHAFDFVPKQYEVATEFVTPQIPEMKIIQLEDYPPHPKTHRMLINIARSYNIAQQPVKAQNDIITRVMRKPTKNAKKINKHSIRKPTNEIKSRMFLSQF